MSNSSRLPSPVDPIDIYSSFAGARSEAEISDRRQSASPDLDPSVEARVADRVKTLRPALEALAIELFENPELRFEEVVASRTLAHMVRSAGIAVEHPAYGIETAFRATVGDSGPHFALLAEYDALPEIGHACGHNIIAAQSVGAFLAAAPEVSRLGGRLSLIGAPAEEGAGGGKELILRAGGFDDVDAAAMVHPGVESLASPLQGAVTSGARQILVTYHGRGAHAAANPYLGLNALDAVVTAYQSVAQLRQHILPIDRVHGIITDGGTAVNVVPSRAAAVFCVRSNQVDTLRVLTQRVVEILEAAAHSTGTVAEIEIDRDPPYLPLRPNLALQRKWAAALERRGRSVPMRIASQASGGGPSTDMGNVSHYLPAIHPDLGIGAPAGILPHHPSFAAATIEPPAFEAVVDGASALAVTALSFLADEDLRRDVEAEFVERGGRYRWVHD